MSRWIAVLSLGLGLALTCNTSWLSSPAFAQGEVEVVGEGTTTETTPAATVDVTTEETIAPKQDFPTKAFIRSMIEQGKISEAENAYLEWASYWQDDDPSLALPVLRGTLMNEFRAGKNMALIMMAQAGDKEAISVLSAQVLSNGDNWPPADLIPAIRFIGASGDKEALNVLRAVMYNDDPSVMNAAIEALGDIGDARIAPELMKMFENADLECSVALARTLGKLGKGKAVQARFEKQLMFRLPGVQEKAALVLAAVGQQKGWPQLQHMLQAKETPYYPLAVTVLGALPTQESIAFVTTALAGGEEEQLAALKSINVLPADKLEATLFALMRDENRPVSVRTLALRMITDHRFERGVKELRGTAMQLDGGEPLMKAEALMSLASYGLLREFSMREAVRQRVTSEEEPVARAARAALIYFMLNMK